MTNPKKIKIRVNLNLLHRKKGDEFYINCDNDGVPLEKYWRARLIDSKEDGCITVIKEKDSESKTETSNNNKNKG